MNIYKQSSLAAYLIIETLNTFSGASRVWGILPIHTHHSVRARSALLPTRSRWVLHFVRPSLLSQSLVIIFMNCRGKWRKASVWWVQNFISAFVDAVGLIRWWPPHWSGLQNSLKQQRWELVQVWGRKRLECSFWVKDKMYVRAWYPMIYVPVPRALVSDQNN